MESGFTVRVLPCNSDNFCYYVFDDESTFTGVLIDPGDESIAEYLLASGIRP